MAYNSYREEYANAFVDLEERTITEILDGEEFVYDLDEFLERLSELSPLHICIDSGYFMHPKYEDDDECDDECDDEDNEDGGYSDYCDGDYDDYPSDYAFGYYKDHDDDDFDDDDWDDDWDDDLDDDWEDDEDNNNDDDDIFSITIEDCKECDSRDTCPDSKYPSKKRSVKHGKRKGRRQ